MSEDSNFYLTILCGECCLAIFSALNPWCQMNAFGSKGCCCDGPRGCCGSCFDGGFNKDSWDEGEANRSANQAGQREEGNLSEPVMAQPEGVPAMAPSATSSDAASPEATTGTTK